MLTFIPCNYGLVEGAVPVCHPNVGRVLGVLNMIVCNEFSLETTLSGNRDCIASSNNSSCDKAFMPSCRSILGWSLALMDLIMDSACILTRSMLGTIFEVSSWSKECKADRNSSPSSLCSQREDSKSVNSFFQLSVKANNYKLPTVGDARRL